MRTIDAFYFPGSTGMVSATREIKYSASIREEDKAKTWNSQSALLEVDYSTKSASNNNLTPDCDHWCNVCRHQNCNLGGYAGEESFILCTREHICARTANVWIIQTIASGKSDDTIISSYILFSRRRTGHCEHGRRSELGLCRCCGCFGYARRFCFLDWPTSLSASAGLWRRLWGRLWKRLLWLMSINIM